MPTIEELLKIYKDVDNRVSKDFLKGKLREIFDALPDLTHIEMYGYTPGFNDGDPCYHRQYVTGKKDEYHVLRKGGSIKCVHEEWIRDLSEDSYDEGGFETDLFSPSQLKALYGWAPYSIQEISPETRRAVNTIMSSQQMKAYITSVYDTNFCLLIYPEGGSVEILDDEYDCGH
jgi:hypothetical protein